MKTITVRKRIAILAIFSVLILSSLPTNVFAKKLTIATQDDTFNKLRDSALLNVAMNAVKKCMSEYPNYNGLDPSTAKKGEVFSNLQVGSYSTARWHESSISNGGDGKYNCDEHKDDQNVISVATTLMKKKPGYLICHGGHQGLFYRAEGDWWNGYTRVNKNCDNFGGGAKYYPNTYSSDGETWSVQLEKRYNEFKAESGNTYLVDYDQIGSYTSVDGFFNYYVDFGQVCELSSNSPATEGNTPSGYDWYWITLVDRSETKMTFKKRAFNVVENKSWDASLGSVEANSCNLLLQRMEYLSENSNYNDFAEAGVDTSGLGDRDKGYYDIISGEFENSCKNLKVKGDDSKSAWVDLHEKLTEIINSEDATAEQKEKAKESRDKIPGSNGDSIDISGVDAKEFVTVTGSKKTMKKDEGMVVQCLDIDEMQLILDEYESGFDALNTGQKEPSCFDNTGALGWVLCPLTEQGGKMVISFYNNLIEPFLMIDVGIFSGTHTANLSGEHTANGLFSVWQFFQFLANLVFVGLFIFIIISQITGFGIDNYGIKKVLPKLIMGAILINASYVICQLSVEVANILGVGIKNLFSGIDVGLTEIEMSGVDNASVSLGSGVAAGAGLVLVVAIITLLIKNAVLALDKVVVAILMMIIIVMISVIFLFVVLSLRYALTILLVVVSPLAFACYMLPNTKKIFSQWFNLFKGLLLAYPISSAMVFGGQFVGEILIAANATGQGAPMVLLFSAAIMSIAPVFLIPSTIRKSMGAIGGLVDRMQGRARGFAGRQRGGLERGMERSRLGQRYQNKRMEHDRNAMINNAKKTQSALEAKRDRKGSLNKADERRLVRAQGVLARDAKENQETYQTGLYGNMNQGDIENIGDGSNTVLGQFTGTDEMFMEGSNFNGDKAVAALSSVADADALTAAYGRLSQSSGFQKKMAESAEFRSRVAGVMSAKGDPINKSIAKLVMAGGVKTQGADGETHMSYNLSDMAQGGGKSQLANKIQGLGNSAMVGMDKDAFNTEISTGDGSTVSTASLFSDSQWASGMGQSGKALENYSAQIADMSSEQQSQILGNASINDIGNITPEAILAFGGYRPGEGKSYADAAAEITANNGDLSMVSDEIRRAAEEGARKINESSKTAMEQIKTTSGDAARAGMNQIAAQMLQIKTEQKPVDVRVTIDHNGGATPPSGGHAGPNPDPMDAPVG